MKELDTVAIAIAQEDKTLENFAKISGRLDGSFPLLADLNLSQAKFIDRTTAYLIDKKGIVREVFPMTIRARPSWNVIIGELEKMVESE